MWLRIAALAVFAVVPAAHAQALPRPDVLTLDDALARVSRTHPELRIFDDRQAALRSRKDTALLGPALRAGATVENAFGSGESRLLDQAELTVTLSGALERGGKLDARRSLAQANLDALGPKRDVARLDLMAETARRYLAIGAAAQRRAIAETDIGQRRRAVEAARRRLDAGASPESVLLTAQAMLARAELDRDSARQGEASARQHLAALWNERKPVFATVSGSPFQLQALDDFDVLADYLDRTPELAQLAGEERVRDAQLRLAQSAATPDIEWNVGVRNLRGPGDTGLVGGFSLPLGSARRAGPEIRAARAERSMLGTQRESLQIQLYSTLSEAHGRYRAAQLEVSRMAADVLPRLVRAENAAESAWRAGATSYMDWAQLQALRIDARHRQLDAALQAQAALIEIQRLTGQASVAAVQPPARDPQP